MTEAEWLACEDPRPMYLFVRDMGSDRKVRLFAVACCYRNWDLTTEEGNQDAALIAERFADGLANDEEIGLARRVARIGSVDEITWETSWAVRLALMERGDIGANVAHRRTLRNRRRSEENAHIGLLRDIFGNPFRSVTINPSWLTSTVLALAQQMYESRDFSAVPILADALQDAGCDNENVLNHCRGESVHVRGCWVVDLLTGRK
jgi:hypothetical protein